MQEHGDGTTPEPGAADELEDGPPRPPAAPPPAPPPTPNVSSATVSSPPTGVANALAALLTACVLVDGVAVGLGYRLQRLLHLFGSDPLAATAEQLDATNRVYGLVGVVQVLLLVVSGIVFIVWLYRSHRHARQVSQITAEHGSGWAIGGWFVPFLNLVRPKQMVVDLWRLTTPPGVPTSLAGGPLRPTAIPLWWFAFIVAGFLGGLGSSLTTPRDAAASLAQGRGGIVVVLASDAAYVVAGCLAIWIVLASAARLQARHEAAVPGRPLAAEPWQPRDRVIAGLAAVAALAAVATGLIGRPASSGAAVAERDGQGVVTGGGTIPMDQLGERDCFDLPDDEAKVFGVAGRPCTAPHQAQVYASFLLAYATDAAWPGEEQVFRDSWEQCLSRFGPALGVSYEDAEHLDAFTFSPTEESWALGDRQSLCVVHRVDRQPLQVEAGR